MKHPDFIIGGATVSGIRGLMTVLDQHPQIFIPRRKEHRFFVQGGQLQRNLETFQTPFEDAVHTDYKERIPADRVLHGEPEYDPARANEGCPNAKIIFTLRNPVERAHAQFLNALSNKKESVRSFEHAIEAELSGLRTPETTGRCWLYMNQYQKHLEHWLSFYPKEHICILIYEEWTDPASGNLKMVEDFLGLKPKSLVMGANLKEKPPKKNDSLDPAIKKQLEELFEVDKSYITKLLGREIPSWKTS